MNYVTKDKLIDLAYAKCWERVSFDKILNGTTIAMSAPDIYMKGGHNKIWLVNYVKSSVSPEFDFCNQAESWLKQFELSVSRLLENAEAKLQQQKPTNSMGLFAVDRWEISAA